MGEGTEIEGGRVKVTKGEEGRRSGLRERQRKERGEITNV